MKAHKLNPQKIKKLSIPLEEFDKRFSEEEKRAIAEEVSYLEILMGLKQNRQELGLSQEELAKRSQVPRATITKIENGQRNVTLKTMLALANAMGKRLKISWI